jgi:hypothetical protein
MRAANASDPAIPLAAGSLPGVENVWRLRQLKHATDDEIFLG